MPQVIIDIKVSLKVYLANLFFVVIGFNQDVILLHHVVYWHDAALITEKGNSLL